MTKTARKRQILYQLYNEGYDPKTAQAYIKSPEGQQRYHNVKIGRSKYYTDYKKWQQQKGTITTPTESPEGTGTVKPMKEAPLQIDVTGKPTPLEQLQVIQPVGAIDAAGIPTPQLMQGTHIAAMFESLKGNYPEKYRWEKAGSDGLGNAWAPIINKWISASSENFLLGFACICTFLVVGIPSLRMLFEWMKERQQERREPPLQKRGKQVEERAFGKK